MVPRVLNGTTGAEWYHMGICYNHILIGKLRGAVTLETVSVRTGARKDTLTNDELTLSGPEVDSTEEGGVTGGGGVSWGGVTVYTVAVNLSLSCFQGGSLEGQRSALVKQCVCNGSSVAMYR